MKLTKPKRKRKMITGWINVYNEIGTSIIHPLKRIANLRADSHRIACIRVRYYKGQGL